MAAGEPETACPCLRLFILLLLRSQEFAAQKSLRRLLLVLCLACLVVFLVTERRRVDKTIHYDVENIRSTAPYFNDLELGSIVYGIMIATPGKSHSLRLHYLSYYL